MYVPSPRSFKFQFANTPLLTGVVDELIGVQLVGLLEGANSSRQLEKTTPDAIPSTFTLQLPVTAAIGAVKCMASGIVSVSALFALIRPYPEPTLKPGLSRQMKGNKNRWVPVALSLTS